MNKNLTSCLSYFKRKIPLLENLLGYREKIEQEITHLIQYSQCRQTWYKLCDCIENEFLLKIKEVVIKFTEKDDIFIENLGVAVEILTSIHRSEKLSE